jgi:phage protein D
VGDVVKEIAARHNLKMALGKDLTDKALDHLDQTNESDASFLMKLARQYGAIASVKDGICCLSGRGREERRAVSRCRLSPSPARPVTVIVLPWLIVVPIPV